MEQTLKTIVTSIVDHPDDVKISEQEENGVMQLLISVNKEDVGKVIGKNGKIIRAIRSVMKIPAVKNNKRIYVSVADSETA